MQAHSTSERSVWYAFLMLGIVPSRRVRSPFQTVSQALLCRQRQVGTGASDRASRPSTDHSAPLRGVRWWFPCPQMLDSEECGRRVGKLYRPPGSRYFSCRRCLDLTYESCQKSHRCDGLFTLVVGTPSREAFETVKGIFPCQTKEAKRRREGHSPDLLDAYGEMFGVTEDRWRAGRTPRSSSWQRENSSSTSHASRVSRKGQPRSARGLRPLSGPDPPCDPMLF
jgi:hypothetical protein